MFLLQNVSKANQMEETALDYLETTWLETACLWGQAAKNVRDGDAYISAENVPLVADLIRE
jgi:hypothetical protein